MTARSYRNWAFAAFMLAMAWSATVPVSAGPILVAFENTLEATCSDSHVHADAQEGSAHCTCDSQDQDCLNYLAGQFCSEALDAFEEYCSECEGCQGISFSDCYQTGTFQLYRDVVCTPTPK